MVSYRWLNFASLALGVALSVSAVLLRDYVDPAVAAPPGCPCHSFADCLPLPSGHLCVGSLSCWLCIGCAGDWTCSDVFAAAAGSNSLYNQNSGESTRAIANAQREQPELLHNDGIICQSVLSCVPHAISWQCNVFSTPEDRAVPSAAGGLGEFHHVT